MMLKERYEWCYRFAEKWHNSGVTAIVSPQWPHAAPKSEDAGDQGTMGEYSFIWNVTGYPSGVMPVTNVLADEQTFSDKHNDGWTKLIQSNCANSEGLPVCI